MASTFFSRLSAVTLFVALQSNAGILVEADAFALNDHKAVYDTTSGLRWLDFGITTDVPLADLATTYSGWRLPTETEVKTLFHQLVPEASWFPHEPYLKEITNKQVYWDEIYDIWGRTYSNGVVEDNATADWSISLRGVFIGDDLTLHGVGTEEFIDGANNAIYFHDILFWHHDVVDGPYNGGALLVRDDTFSVPEPSPVMLLLAGLLATCGLRRRTSYRT